MFAPIVILSNQVPILHMPRQFSFWQVQIEMRIYYHFLHMNNL